MAKKLLVPVLPSERFYDAVVAAGDYVASEGGVLTFLFTQVRPPAEVYEEAEGHPTDVDLSIDEGDFDPADVERWRNAQVAALEEARQMLYERGVGDDRIDYVFADDADAESAAQAIADEAAAGSYDLVVLSRGYVEDEVDEQGSSATEILDAIEKNLAPEVRVMMA